MFAALIISQALTAAPVLPAGWLKACATGEATHCEVASVTTEDLFWLNVAVNHMIKPKADVGGEVESWRVFPAEGDCSDYTLSKRAVLLAWGVDPKRLTIELGEHYRVGQWRRHMNLRVVTPSGDLILDNIQDQPYAPAARPFPWRAIASQPSAGPLWTTPED